jgi:predicted metal-dependent hydrolase
MIDFQYQIIRRPRRKTAYISVEPNCSVRVLVPFTLSEEKVIELVHRKSRWIRTKIDHFEEINHNQKQNAYVSGESFTYLGRNYRLKIVPGDFEEVKLMNGRFYVHIPTGTPLESRNQAILSRLTCWYKEHAIKRLRLKVSRYAKQVGVTPVSVGLKDYISRWGSCHTDGRIFFNWKVTIAPHSIVDYVVVHELCHLIHGDHSKQFWKLLETILPDYAERKKWLKVNGIGLKI